MPKPYKFNLRAANLVPETQRGNAPRPPPPLYNIIGRLGVLIIIHILIEDFLVGGWGEELYWYSNYYGTKVVD